MNYILLILNFLIIETGIVKHDDMTKEDSPGENICFKMMSNKIPIVE